MKTLKLLFCPNLKMKNKDIDRFIIALAVAGVLISTYALYVEISAEYQGPGYRAMCDFAEGASCTKVLTSVYAKGFGLLGRKFQIPNCVFGIFYYCYMIFLTTYQELKQVKIQLGACIAGALSSVYLAYLLAFVLHDLCIVCVSTYFVNAGLLVLVYCKWSVISKKIKNQK